MDNAKFITFVSLHKTVFFGLASVLVLLLIVSKGKNVIYDCVHKADDINAAGGFSHPLQLHKDLSSNMVQSGTGGTDPCDTVDVIRSGELWYWAKSVSTFCISQTVDA